MWETHVMWMQIALTPMDPSTAPGFTGDGLNCTDIDECEMNIHDCHFNGTCQNAKGSFNCSCEPGFIGNGTNCTDINECDTSIHDCHSNANCSNTGGSYSCTCNSGYTGDGFNCTDIDECTAGTHQCHPNGACANTEGSYTCACGVWYTPVADTGNRNCTPCKTLVKFYLFTPTACFFDLCRQVLTLSMNTPSFVAIEPILET